MTEIPMFVFPHAGAASRAYQHWGGVPGYATTVLDRPGRGAGLPGVTHPADAAAVAAASAERIRSALDEHAPSRWVVFGHSFGALLAFAAVRALEGVFGLRPSLLVLSASPAPAFQAVGDTAAELDDGALNAHILAIGQTRSELLDGPTGVILRRYFREDQALRTSLSRAHGKSSVHVPLLTIAAEDDAHVTPEQVAAWSAHSTAPTSSVVIGGGHFAASQSPELVTTAIDQCWRGR